MNRHSINDYSTYSVKKAAIAERVICALKNALYKAFSLRGKYRWLDILDKVTAEYNAKKHRTIEMKAIDVTAATRLDVYDHIKLMGKIKFKVGDHVRISKFKTVFEKGYSPYWSTEIFKIVKVKVGKPVTYLLEDSEGKPILGQFYAEELLLTKHPDIYLVESVLKRKGDKVYVRWLGFDDSHNSWIDKTNIIR